MFKKISELWNRFLEWSFQKQANKIFDKSDIKYRDGDNT